MRKRPSPESRAKTLPVAFQVQQIRELKGEAVAMDILAVFGGLLAGALILAGIRALAVSKKSNRVVVSLH